MLDALSAKNLPGSLKAIGMKLVAKVGGASGPLYGTLFWRWARNCPARSRRGRSAAAFAAAIEAVKARGKSDVGQKTMLDVLVPVSKRSQPARTAVLSGEARPAADATIPMRATRGRASFLGERSVGHMDPGARSAR